MVPFKSGKVVVVSVDFRMLCMKTPCSLMQEPLVAINKWHFKDMGKEKESYWQKLFCYPHQFSLSPLTIHSGLTCHIFLQSACEQCQQGLAKLKAHTNWNGFLPFYYNGNQCKKMLHHKRLQPANSSDHSEESNLRTVWMHYMDTNKTYGEKAWRQLHKNAMSNIEQVLEATSHKTAAIGPLTTHHKNYPKLDKSDMRDTAGEVGTNS